MQTYEFNTALSDELKRIVAELEQLEAEEARILNLKARLQIQREGIRFTLEDVARRLEKPSSRSPISEVDPQFRDKSIRQILHYLARVGGKRLKATAVLDELMRANFYSTRDSARNSVYSAFQKGMAKGEWQRVDQGVYEQLLDPYAPSTNGHVRPLVASENSAAA